LRPSKDKRKKPAHKYNQLSKMQPHPTHTHNKNNNHTHREKNMHKKRKKTQ
jgi:hypothetical protein